MGLSGIFTPNMTPLDADGQINEAELRRYIDWLIEHGVNGLYPNGSTGEFTRFTPEERRRITEIICDQTHGRVPILAGAAEANVRETLHACEAYCEFGATAVAIVSPIYYRLSPGAVYAYFREIALNTPIDVTLYNIPMFASPIDVPTVQRLSEFPRIIGIKDSSGDISQMLRMMAAVEPARPDFAFLCGWEPAMVPMLAMGCQGGTFAESSLKSRAKCFSYPKPASSRRLGRCRCDSRRSLTVLCSERISRKASARRSSCAGSTSGPVGNRLMIRSISIATNWER